MRAESFSAGDPETGKRSHFLVEQQTTIYNIQNVVPRQSKHRALTWWNPQPHTHLLLIPSILCSPAFTLIAGVPHDDRGVGRQPPDIVLDLGRLRRSGARRRDARGVAPRGVAAHLVARARPAAGAGVELAEWAVALPASEGFGTADFRPLPSSRSAQAALKALLPQQ